MILVDVLLDLISLMVGGYWSFMITDRNKKKRKEKEVSLNMLWILLLSMYGLLTVRKANVKIMVGWLICEVDVR